MKINGFSPGLAPAAKETTRVIERALRRLSTGQAWRDPKENLVGYRLSQNLEAATRGKAAQLQNLTQASSLEREKETVLQQQLETTERLRALALEASSSTLSAADRSRLQAEFSALISEFDRMRGESRLGIEIASEVFSEKVGTGRFQQVATIASDSILAVGNFNSDGNLDYVALGAGSVRVKLGQGDGSFQTASTSSLGGNVEGVTAADLNSDGVDDVIISSDQGLQVYLNSGSGVLGQVTSYGGSQSAGDVAASDIDADGDLDLIRANLDDQVLEIYSNDGLGRFSLSATIAETTPDELIDVQMGDVDGDGDQDLVYSHTRSTGTGLAIHLHRNSGIGTFGSAELLVEPTDNVDSFSLVDIDFDGDLDITYLDDVPYIFANNGNASFSYFNDSLGGQGARFFDVNKDGALDSISNSSWGVNFGSRSGAPVGGFSSPFTSTELEIGDFNNDGLIDVLSGGQGVFLGLGRERSGLSSLSLA
jgi:flagellin-like hook-associated protein FlgL